MNPVNIKNYVKTVNAGQVELYSSDTLKYLVLKIKTGSTHEINNPCSHVVIRCETGNVCVGTRYRQEDKHPHYEHLHENETYIISDCNYFELSCEEDQKATVTILEYKMH